MEIFGFLLGLGCLVVIAWAMPAAVCSTTMLRKREATIALVTGIGFGRKGQQQKRAHGQKSLKLSVSQKPTTAKTSTPVIPLPP